MTNKINGLIPVERINDLDEEAKYRLLSVVCEKLSDLSCEINYLMEDANKDKSQIVRESLYAIADEYKFARTNLVNTAQDILNQVERCYQT